MKTPEAAKEDAKQIFQSNESLRVPSSYVLDQYIRDNLKNEAQTNYPYYVALMHALYEEHRKFFYEKLQLDDFVKEFKEFCARHRVELSLDMDTFFKEGYSFQHH